MFTMRFHLCPQIKQDLRLLALRGAFDPKRFYRNPDATKFPKYFQMGTVVEGPTDFYSGASFAAKQTETSAAWTLSEVPKYFQGLRGGGPYRHPAVRRFCAPDMWDRATAVARREGNMLAFMLPLQNSFTIYKIIRSAGRKDIRICAKLSAAKSTDSSCASATPVPPAHRDMTESCVVRSHRLGDEEGAEATHRGAAGGRAAAGFDHTRVHQITIIVDNDYVSKCRLMM